MNILDDGLLPYTRMNGSTFPAPDPAVISQSPKPDAPDYLAKTLDFVRAMAPDTFDGEPVNFAKTFFGSVRAEDAYPNGVPDGGEALLPYFNLEIWGLPTSKPARDPTNPTSSTSASSAASCTTTKAAAAPRACCWPTTSRR